MLIVYTDGSFNSYTKVAGWAFIVYTGDGKRLHFSHGHFFNCKDPQRAEQAAIRQALQWLQGYKRDRLFSSVEFRVDRLDIYMEGTAMHHKTAFTRSVQRMMTPLCPVVYFQWIPREENTEADALARRGRAEGEELLAIKRRKEIKQIVKKYFKAVKQYRFQLPSPVIDIVHDIHCDEWGEEPMEDYWYEDPDIYEDLYVPFYEPEHEESTHPAWDILKQLPQE